MFLAEKWFSLRLYHYGKKEVFSPETAAAAAWAVLAREKPARRVVIAMLQLIIQIIQPYFKIRVIILSRRLPDYGLFATQKHDQAFGH